MLSFSGSLKIFVALEPCDMRKGFNGLYGLVGERLGEDPRTGTLFVLLIGATPTQILYFGPQPLGSHLKNQEKHREGFQIEARRPGDAACSSSEGLFVRHHHRYPSFGSRRR
jgi:hypothetical protein